MYEEECETTYSYGKQCKKVPVEKCDYETVEKCKLEPVKKCRTIYKTECQKVPRKIVETVIITSENIKSILVPLGGGP